MNRGSPQRLERFLLIVLLAALAFTQPLLDLFGGQAEFLVAQQLSPAGLVAFAVALSIVIPGTLGLLPLLANRLGARAGSAVFHLLFFILAALTVLPALKTRQFHGAITLVIAVLTAVAAIVVYRRFSAVRMFFRFLSPAVLLFPLVFLFFSRATPLLLADQEQVLDGRITIGSKHDIVFLVLDEFPLVSLLNSDLELNRERFPNFGRLADVSYWYRGATTGSDTTVGAVPSLLSGLHPDPSTRQLPITANFPRNLFTMLGDDYQVTANETATRLCPAEVCDGLAPHGSPPAAPGTLLSDVKLIYLHIVMPQPWSDRLPSISNAWTGFTAGDVSRSADEAAGGLEYARALADLSGNVSWSERSSEVHDFIASIKAEPRPRLHYLHSLLPHAVWRYLPDGRQYLVKESWEAIQRNTGPGITDLWQDDPFAVNQQWQRHLLQVQYVDTLLGVLLDRMENEGMLETHLLVIAGDHGTSFIPGQPRRSVNETTLSDISAVPLFIHVPGQIEGVIDDRAAMLADVMPTLTDVLDVAPKWRFDGASLLGQPPERNTIKIAKKSGGVMEFTPESQRRHLERRASELDSVFGHEPGEIFTIGPHSELLGTSPSDWPLGNGDEGSVELADEQLFLEVSPEASFVPRRIRGNVTGLPEERLPADLAIVVNGTIRATTRTLDIDSWRTSFSAVLPDSALLAGRNSVEAYLLETPENGLRLSQLGRPTGLVEWALKVEGETETLERIPGGSFSVRGEESVLTAVSAQEETGALIMLAGAISESGAKGSEVLAFLDGRFAGSGKAGGESWSILVAPGAGDRHPATSARVFLLDENAHLAHEASYPAPCSPQWLFAPPAAWGGTDCAAAARTPLTAVDSGYAARLEISDPSVRQYLVSGWGAQHGGIAWTLGKSAQLRIPLPQGLWKISVRAMIKPFLHPPGLDAQHLHVTANGLPVGSWTLEDNRYSEITLEVPPFVLQGKPEFLELDLLLPDAVSPKSLGAGEDLRALGIALQFVEITAR